MKLCDFLRLRLRKPPAEKNLNWGRCLQGLPDWLQVAVRDYLAFCRAKWPVERRHKLSTSRLSHLTLSLRWMCLHTELKSPADITPALWFQYVDDCLAKGKSACTVNSHQATLQAFVHFLDDNGVAACERFFLVDYLKVGPTIPKDASINQLRKVFLAIEHETLSSHAWCRRCATMDRAWFLLMLHCGLRTGEVRRLRWCDCDLGRRQVRIEQSKGLKDRVVFLSPAVVSALEAYREVRGPQDCLPEQVFIFRHAPMSVSYAYTRLQHYGSVCGVTLTPHQLRHSCATLLLNAGAPVVSVQAILGHKYIDTTLNYARLYDGTLAADYYRAMNEVERLLELVEQPNRLSPSPGELIALVDSLRCGTLNENQVEVVQALRDGILALARKEQSENAMEDVKVLMLAES